MHDWKLLKFTPTATEDPLPDLIFTNVCQPNGNQSYNGAICFSGSLTGFFILTKVVVTNEYFHKQLMNYSRRSWLPSVFCCDVYYLRLWVPGSQFQSW